MQELENLIEQRDIQADGFGPWYWVKSDNGAWDGPCKDWETSHKIKYFTYIKGYHAVLTAGANLGMYSHFYSKMFDVVWAFEPDYLNFHCLVNNNQLPNVIKMQAILGSECGVAGINQENMSNVGMHKVKNDGFIPKLTIDSLNLPFLDLLQLDVEGYEYPILQGAIETIKKFLPVVVAENGESNDIRELMIGLGYHCVDRSISDSIWIPN